MWRVYSIYISTNMINDIFVMIFAFGNFFLIQTSMSNENSICWINCKYIYICISDWLMFVLFSKMLTLEIKLRKTYLALDYIYQNQWWMVKTYYTELFLNFVVINKFLILYSFNHKSYCPIRYTEWYIFVNFKHSS